MGKKIEFPLDMPQNLINRIKRWKTVSKSPYSSSYYNTQDKSWEHTPSNSLRVSDHWNFTTLYDNNIHCRTDKQVPDGHWCIAKYSVKKHKYEVIKCYPKDTKKLIRHWATIFKEDGNRYDKIFTLLFNGEIKKAKNKYPGAFFDMRDSDLKSLIKSTKEFKPIEYKGGWFETGHDGIIYTLSIIDRKRWSYISRVIPGVTKDKTCPFGILSGLSNRAKYFRQYYRLADKFENTLLSLEDRLFCAKHMIAIEDILEDVPNSPVYLERRYFTMPKLSKKEKAYLDNTYLPMDLNLTIKEKADIRIKLQKLGLMVGNKTTPLADLYMKIESGFLEDQFYKGNLGKILQ